MTKSLNLSLSLFSLLFITGLVTISYYRYVIENDFLNGLLELVTIPVIFMTIILFVVNAIKWSREKWSVMKSAFPALIILALSLGIMVFSTIYNI